MNAAAVMERGERPAPVWRDQLPEVRGRLVFDAPLAPLTWFKVGGPADVLFQPADEDDLVRVLAGLDPAVPVTVLGYGSNVIVRDGGIAGLVVRLPKSFARMEIHHCCIIAGAAAGDVLLANTAAEAGIAGFEFLRGIPGTIGGAVRSNAGAFGGELSDVVRRIRIHDRAQGSRRWVEASEFAFGYRTSAIPREWIVLALEMEGRPDSREKIARRMEALIAERERSQPLRTRTGGSTFRNPPAARAWELIEAAGCRGLRLGGARVSEKHCNFLINEGGIAADLEALGEEVRRRVRETSGITLEWEIERLGRSALPHEEFGEEEVMS